MPWPHGVPVVDAHVHLPRTEGMRPELVDLLRRHPAFQDLDVLGRDPQRFLSHLDGEGIRQAWIITYNAPRTMGYGRPEAEAVWDFCATDPERLVAVGGYDLSDGDPGRAVEEMAAAGVRVLKLHPVHQHLPPDDGRLAGLYDAAQERRMPVLVHTGPSVFPGADNAYADPAPLAHVAARWPDLPLVIAHGGRPDRTGQALRVLREHPNTWLDLSGCPPGRLRDYFGDLEPLAPRTLWGSDWPGPRVPGMGANVEAFRALGLSEAAERAILHDNATGLLERVRV